MATATIVRFSGELFRQTEIIPAQKYCIIGYGGVINFFRLRGTQRGPDCHQFLLRPDSLEDAHLESFPHRLSAYIRRRLQKIPAIRSWQTNRQFGVERALLKNRPIDTTEQPSVLHFSVNKVATQYTKRVMLRCAEENGLLPVRMSDYAWFNEFPYLFTLSAAEVQPYLHVFRPHGFLYTVFGGLVEAIPDIQKYRTVVMLRDPRDVLVSGYYSYKISHKMPPSQSKASDFEVFRARVQSQTVDEYVIEMSEDTRWRMQQYLDLRKTGPGVTILRYEDMIADFPAWLNRLLEHCQWKISPSLKEKLLHEAMQAKSSKKEKTTSHKRQVFPGDHKRKLEPQTIDHLNNYFSSILNELGYK